MRRKVTGKKKEQEDVNEFAHEAEVQGDMSHEEAVEASHSERAVEASAPVIAEPKKEEGELAAPQLHGKRRVGKGPKKFEQPGTNNQSREVAPETDDDKPDLDDGEPELEN